MLGNNSNNNPHDAITLRELKEDDNVNISLGSSEFVPLKSFLKNNAKQYHQKDLAKTYVLSHNDNDKRVLGYVTLVCSQISISDNIPEDIDKYPYDDFPSVKIVRLAVDKGIARNGWGSALINWSIAVSKKKIMQYVGCRFLIVDAKPSAIGFYEKNGFTLLDTEENKKSEHPMLYIDLHKL